MIAHPFDIKSSVATKPPDELMVTWGNIPTSSVATLYLPAVSAGDIITLADKMYVKHRLTAVDMHTVQFPSGNVAFVPVPPGQGRYAGLLSVSLSPTVQQGGIYTIAVRQLTQVSAAVAPPPPPPPQPQIAATPRQAAAVGKPITFSWRQVLGAFQYTITVKPPQDLLYPQERLLAWLKWRISVTPPSSRWLPVLERYLSSTGSLVQSLGGNPNGIPPSQVGSVPGKRPGPHPVPPFPPVKGPEYTGKVAAIDYDRFGDFCGFVILNEEGHEHHFRGRELEIEELVREAWEKRTVVTVVVEEHERDWPVRLILRRYH